MAEKKSWTRSDVGRSRWEESVFLGHDQLGVADCTVSKRTLHGGLQDGVDIVHVNNGELSFSVMPTRQDRRSSASAIRPSTDGSGRVVVPARRPARPKTT